MKRHSSNWKARELKVARKLKGERIPLSGSLNMGKIGDVELAGYAIEVKSGRQVPKAVTDWLLKIRSEAKDGQIPVLVMHPFQMKESIAVLTLGGLGELIARIQPNASALGPRHQAGESAAAE